MTSLVELKQRIVKILLIWGIPSVIFGTILLVSLQFTLPGGIGLMAIIWGAIDLIMAYYILKIQKEDSVEKIQETVSKSIRMDIIFQVVGLIVIIVLIQDPYMVGSGIGVIIQGFFLLLLDLYYRNALDTLVG